MVSGVSQMSFFQSVTRARYWVLLGLLFTFQVAQNAHALSLVTPGDELPGGGSDGGGSQPTPTATATSTNTPIPTVTETPIPTPTETAIPPLPTPTPAPGPVDPPPPQQPDLCPADPLKIAPGVCGCGAADIDLNQNSIMDCLITDEFAYRTKLARTNVKLVKKHITNKIKSKQKKVRKLLRQQLHEMVLFQKSNAGLIQISSPKVNLKKLTRRASKLTRALLRASESDFRLARIRSNKSFKRLAKGINGTVQVLPG